MIHRLALLPMLLLAAAAGAEPAVAPGPNPIAPIYPGPDGRPHYLVGITAHGKAEDLARLAHAAGAHGWPSRRELAGQPPMLIIAFPKADPAKVSDFLRRASAGEYGAFTFESELAPVPGERG